MSFSKSIIIIINIDSINTLATLNIVTQIEIILFISHHSMQPKPLHLSLPAAYFNLPIQCNSLDTKINHLLISHLIRMASSHISVYISSCVSLNKSVLYCTQVCQLLCYSSSNPMGLYHPLDGVTNLKYKLLYFLTPNKKIFKEKGTSF